jgi:putative PIN family toxin of toxin-antitoxin system
MSENAPARSLRAVVDTNLFVSGLITPAGLPARLIDALLDRAFTVVTSTELTLEVIDVLGRPSLVRRYQFDVTIMQALIERLATAEHVDPLPGLPLTVRDPDDEMLLACALAAGVPYLVTGDQDLLVLDGAAALGCLRIVTVRVFLELLEENAP